MRNKIKMFAQKKVTLPAGNHKIVILDEADRFVNLVSFKLFFFYLYALFCLHVHIICVNLV